jgi:predicted RNase H-like nuclease (RuvC/YqgF family)
MTKIEVEVDEVVVNGINKLERKVERLTKKNAELERQVAKYKERHKALTDLYSQICLTAETVGWYMDDD